MLKPRWNNYNCKITDEIKNSGYTTSYDKPADGSTITVSATITDTA